MLQKPLRDYQEAAVMAALDGFEKEIEGIGGPYLKQLLVEPTGSGKTPMFAAAADYCYTNWKKPVLVLVDQIDLADQARDEILQFTDLFPQIEQGERTASPMSPIVIASVQSIANRLDKFARNRFGLVIADEADRSVSDQWQKVLTHFDEHARVLGVTATPDRGDQRNVLDYYERIAHETQLFDLIRQGYLSRIMVQTCPLGIDISKVKQIGGDYDKEELDKVLTPYFGEVCENILKFASDRKILVFVPLIDTSKRFVEIARDHGIKAEHIDGSSPDREEIKARYRNKEITLLCNAMLLGRGFNDRSIDCIVNLRPTRSPSLYRQFVGRGTRIFCPHGCAERCEHKEAKQDLLLLDFIWTFHRLGLQRPANLIATSADHAKKLTDYSVRQSGRLLDLEGIDSKVALEAEKALLKQLKESRKLRAGRFDAMDFAVQMHQRELIEYVPRAKWESKPVTEKQAAALQRIGFALETVQNFGHAHAILDALSARRKKGLATLKQVKMLRRFGVAQPELVTFDGAKAWLDWRLNHVPMPEGMVIYAVQNQEASTNPAVDDYQPNVPTDEPVYPADEIDGELEPPAPPPRSESLADKPVPAKPPGTNKFRDKFAAIKKAIQPELFGDQK